VEPTAEGPSTPWTNGMSLQQQGTHSGDFNCQNSKGERRLRKLLQSPGDNPKPQTKNKTNTPTATKASLPHVRTRSPPGTNKAGDHKERERKRARRERGHQEAHTRREGGMKNGGRRKKAAGYVEQQQD